MKAIIVFFSVVAIILLLFFSRYEWLPLIGTTDQATASKGAQKQRPAREVKVIVEPVVMTENNKSFRGIGTGHALASVDLFPPLEGEVASIEFKTGQMVQQGEVLLQLDDKEAHLALKSARVERSNALKSLRSYQQLVGRGGVTETQLDEASADYDAAQVAFEQAQLALEDHQVTAPFTGVLGMAQIEIGDQVTPQTMLTSIDARATFFIDFDVPESLVGALIQAHASRQSIAATTPAYPMETFSGVISQYDSRLDSERRTLLARASIDNKNDKLRPGMSFEVLWEIPGNAHATVAEIALQWGRDGAYVWSIREGKAHKIPVQVIARKFGRVLLDGNISEGDWIVIEGVQRLRPERAVKVLNPPEVSNPKLSNTQSSLNQVVFHASTLSSSGLADGSR